MSGVRAHAHEAAAPRPSAATAELGAAVVLLTGLQGPVHHFPVAERRVEFDGIVGLLMLSVTPGVAPRDAEQVAHAIAAGCLGERHLWRDLGLPNRRMLRLIIERYFEPFAADNVMDMRWKKFIYRRLCRWGGFNTCKAPSCGVCPTYEECFGEPE